MSNDAIYAYLTALYGDQPEGLLWIGGQADGWRGRTFDAPEAAAAYARELDERGGIGVYHRLTTLAQTPARRGTDDDTGWVYALGMDLDIDGPGHKPSASGLPHAPDEETLFKLLDLAGMPAPTFWTASGGGYYPIWQLDEPLDARSEDGQERARALLKGTHARIKDVFTGNGYALDGVFDLSRVYRLPGTWNRKPEMPAPVLAEVREWSPSARYGVTRFEMPAARQEVAGGSPFVQPSQLFNGSAAPTPWTYQQAMDELGRQFETIKDARSNINTVVGGAARRAGRFAPGVMEVERIVATLLVALEQGGHHSDEWNAANGRDWTGFSLIDTAVRRGAAMPFTVLPKPSEEIGQAVPTGRLRRALMTRTAVRDLPDPVPLIEDVLYRESVVVLSGKFGTYKSFVAVSWAASLASGTDWFGHRVPHAVPVIYAAAEGAYGIRKRLDAWEKEYGAIPDDLYLISVSVRLNRDPDVAELEEIIQETGAKVLIFDTLHMSTPGVDENDSGEMGAVMDRIRDLQQKYGLTSILPHHTGHAGERARGSSSVEDDADTSFVIRLDGEDRGPSGKRTLVHRKTKDAALLEPVELTLKLIEGTGSGVVTSANAFERAEGEEAPEDWEVLHGVVQRQIYRVLIDQGGTIGLTQSECRRSVADRWYGGQSGRAVGLRSSTWATAWTTVQEKQTAAGDHIVVRGDGEKRVLDPLAFEALNTSLRVAKEAS